MENTTFFAFYGSLRRGMENYILHKDHLKYLFSARLRGYALYSKGEFPVAVRSGNFNDSIVIEIFNVTDRTTREMIHKLELDEGYDFETITVDGIEALIYLYKAPENYQPVPGGDWVTFFRETH